MVDWKNLEERGARWANMLSLLPGSYCAYIDMARETHGGDVEYERCICLLSCGFLYLYLHRRDTQFFAQ